MPPTTVGWAVTTSLAWNTQRGCRVATLPVPGARGQSLAKLRSGVWPNIGQSQLRCAGSGGWARAVAGISTAAAAAAREARRREVTLRTTDEPGATLCVNRAGRR